ncbi:Protein of unknown function DUF2062 [Hyphomicrobium denitrificans ATCC 51888]|jgi:uncharacterized protein (DUF2062 family)|uniref:DUF2062 domain-containing protein n=1 Tax=Hyphomicrobium denitrificans (strain ATCC 51888 / DSM 1869 / NCIMB 11706 / TK 0415) TaxID=582899 RepID=D8JR58_HYPDA|nr:Protein of unknown function DUF2062 [Hyphomicrobium denitrificans ATCC 51888]
MVDRSLRDRLSVASDVAGRWALKLVPLRKRLTYYWRRILRLRATPHEVALGCAAGVFAACTPFLGFQMALAGAIAFLLRVSIPAALLGTFIGNPLSWPAIWSASYVAGVWVLGDDPADAAEHFVQSANKLSATLMAPSRSLDSAVVSLSPIIEPLVIGGLLVGLIAAVFSYYPTRQAVRVFQKRRRAR